jgi:hypothetical protein
LWRFACGGFLGHGAGPSGLLPTRGDNRVLRQIPA